MESAEPAAVSRPMPLRTFCRRVGLGAAVVYGAMLVWQCWCVTGLGGWSTRGIELFVLFPVGGLLLLVAGLPLLLLRRTRRLAARCSIAAAMLLAGGLVAIGVGAR